MRRAKITVPLRPPGFVERPSVRAALEAQSRPRERGRVVLVSAPAGYGKTVAVTDWVRADPDVAAAWVGLDAGDRDERRWWASVLGALTACPAVAEESPLYRFAPSWTDDSARAETVSDILEALDGLTHPVRLVLDDLQTIADPGAMTGLQELLRHPSDAHRRAVQPVRPARGDRPAAARRPVRGGAGRPAGVHRAPGGRTAPSGGTRPRRRPDRDPRRPHRGLGRRAASREPVPAPSRRPGRLRPGVRRRRPPSPTTSSARSWPTSASASTRSSPPRR